MRVIPRLNVPVTTRLRLRERERENVDEDDGDAGGGGGGGGGRGGLHVAYDLQGPAYHVEEGVAVALDWIS